MPSRTWVTCHHFALEHFEQRTLLSGPLVITTGGTYSGTFESFDRNVPAITIQTSQPVVIENSILRGRGALISSSFAHSKITVRNTQGFGLNPNVLGKAPGRFVDVENFDSMRIENCYLENTAGIYLLNYAGNRTASQSISIVDNKAKNIDGRRSNGTGGWLDYNTRTAKKRKSSSEDGMDLVQFVQFDKIQSVPGMEIAWNEVVNEPGNSRVEDNINIYQSSGTPSSALRIHDNYIQGAYTIKPWQSNTSDTSYNYDWSFSGGGILLSDGVGSTAGGDPAFVRAFNNQIVSTTNYGIAIAAGHDNEFYNNRIVSSGLLPDGRAIANQNVGAYVWDSYSIGTKRFYNNKSYNNLVGWVQGSGRNDWWSPDLSTVNSNIHWPGTITRAVETAEYTLWLGKLAGHRGPPAVPANLVATVLSPTRVDLTWGNVAGETQFKIERSPDSVAWTQIATTNTDQTSYSDVTVQPDGAYIYRVRATNAGGDSDYSNTASATTPHTPAAPGNLTAFADSFDHVDLTWTDNADNETSFIIERSPDGATNWLQIAIAPADAVTFSDTTNIIPGTTYFYRLRATHPTGGDSAYSDIASATTIQIVPLAPTGLAASAASVSRINLTWTDNANNESSFILERSPDGTIDWTLLATPSANATSYSDTSLLATTTYFYRLRATNVVGDSENSAIASATTPAEPTVPEAPSGLAASAASASQINLTWTDNSSDETNFLVERSPDGANSWSLIATLPANTGSHNNTALTASTTYFYRVRATSAVGPSDFSNTANATTLAAPALPAPWQSADIGAVTTPGSAVYSNGIYTVKGAGSDIWGTADSFRFVYQPFTGNGQIVARVTGVQNTNAGAHAGVMIRESLAASSKHALLALTANNGIGFVRRTSTGGSSSVSTASGATAYYLKLIRNGSTITAYRSSTGTSWTQVGSAVTISMTSTVFIGLAVCSKNPSTLCTATFTNVTLSTSTSSTLPPGSGVTTLSAERSTLLASEDPLQTLLG
jgi:hypothetical protein